jgi:hypothetical protein
MLFTPVDPGVWDQGKFGSDIHYSPPSLPCRLFYLFLEEFYNAVALLNLLTLLCKLPKEPYNRDFLHIYAKNPQVQQAARAKNCKSFCKTNRVLKEVQQP